MAQPSSNVPYAPLEPPSSPRFPPENYGLHAPQPLYDAPSAMQSSASLNASFRPGANYRQSDYDSVHGLNGRDSTFGSSFQPYRDDPSTAALPMDDMGTSRPHMTEKRARYAPNQGKKRLTLILVAIIVVLLIAAAVALPVYFAVIRPKLLQSNSSNSNSTNSHNGNNNNNSNDHGKNNQNLLTWGGDGTEVETEDGSKFTYSNKFGGYWVYDPANPMNNSARAQSTTPALSDEFKYGVDRIRGVNIGGWLNMEPFITPEYYEEFFPDAVDEWTLSEHIQAKYGSLDRIENHYKTFITEEDFAQIAGAGLNYVRIPIAFWAIEKYSNEPFLEKVSWKYFLKAIQWARKYGIRINLDLHALPGSQNGWNHSGRLGTVNFLSGVMGKANAQRGLDYIRILAEFISQPEYSAVVPFFGIANEPIIGGTPEGLGVLRAFYAEAYRVIRDVGGIGAGNGPYISYYEGFAGVDNWAGWLQGADRISLDFHPYFAFDGASPDPLEAFIPKPCGRWGESTANSMKGFGLTAAGEFSNAINDCGLYLNAVGVGTRYEGTFPGFTTKIGDCSTWNDWNKWDQTIKDNLKQFMMASMDALQNYFFWTWKIGNSTATGKVETPFWSYKLALDQGWAPTDPRDADGQCARLGAPYNGFTGELQSWQVGGAGAGVVPTIDDYKWPLTAVVGFPDAAALPTYTATGTIPTLPVATYTDPADNKKTIDVGDGWTNDNDKTLMSVPDPNCAYPDAYNANDVPVPKCGAGARRRDMLAGRSFVPPPQPAAR